MSLSTRILLISSALIAPTVALATPQPAVVKGLEQTTYEYQILREGDPVGSHHVQVQHHDDHTRVVCRSDIEIGLLGLTFYRFRYRSDEEWDDRGLRRLVVRVDDDGELLEIDGRRNGDEFRWLINDEASKTHEMPVYPTNHWNPAVLSQTRVLNTLTGAVNEVSIRPQSKDEAFDWTLGEVKNYRYNGELRLDAWYDANGRWMGMRFLGRDGSTIEYRCQNCSAQRWL